MLIEKGINKLIGGTNRMNAIQNQNISATFDLIFRTVLDQQYTGRSIDCLDTKITIERIQNAMLDIIHRQGLINVLLADLGLCSLCSVYNSHRKVRQ